jgi:multidrug efflux system membrane fusion protein
MRADSALLLCGLLSLAGCGGSAPITAGAASVPVATVRIAQAQRQSLPVELAVTGRVEPVASATVKAQASGVVTRVHFHEGDLVRAGDLLFEIDRRPYEESVKVLEANLAKDQALTAQAEASLRRAIALEAFALEQLTRYQKLRAEGVASAQQADQITVDARSRQQSVHVERAAVDSAKAAAGATAAALAQARLQLSFCAVRAPIAGRTGSLALRTGNLAKANESDLVSIHSTAPVYVSFAVPEDHLATLRQRMESAGLTVSAQAPGDHAAAAPGRVSFLENSVDSRTGTIRARAEMTNADGRFWPGQFVEVKVLLEERPQAIVVPAAALQTGQAGNFLYVVGTGDLVEQRPVVAGPRASRLVSIEQGLAAGERIVTEGHLRLTAGMKVRQAQ